MFAIQHRQKSNKKSQNPQIKQKIPKSSKNQTKNPKILKSSDIPQNPTKLKILKKSHKKSPNPQKSNKKPMARQPPRPALRRQTVIESRYNTSSKVTIRCLAFLLRSLWVTWMSGWKLGSMVGTWVISPILINRVYLVITHVLTIF